MNNQIRKMKGITLIALIVTIIVLLILAGVSIAMLTGENSIIRQATKAKEETESNKLIEKIKLATMAAQIEGLGRVTYDNLVIELNKEFKVNEYSIIRRCNY